MKKALWGLGILITLGVLVVFIAPTFLDWNAYRDRIAVFVSQETGRPVKIEGRISAALLPAPTLKVERVSLGNHPRGDADHLARFDSLKVRLSLSALLTGKIIVETVSLIDPVVFLERYADGSVNWELGKPAAIAVDQPAGTTTTSSAPALRIDHFTVENGTVIFSDQAGGRQHALEGVNATISAGSLTGPFEIAGSLAYQGIPLDVELTTNRIIPGQPTPVKFRLATAGTENSIRFNGVVTQDGAKSSAKGALSATGQSLARLLGDLGHGGTYPGGLDKPFSLESSIFYAQSTLEVPKLKLSLGEVQLDGGGLAVLGDIPSVDLSLTAKRVDLDSLLGLGTVRVEAARPPANRSNGDNGPRATALLAQPAENPTTTTAPLTLPKAIDAALNLRLDALYLRGEAIRQATVHVALSDGLFTVNQITAVLPGNAELGLFGFLSLTDGKPVFKGNGEFKAGNLRTLLTWAGIEVPSSIPANRLRGTTAKSDINLTPETLSFRGLTVEIDRTKINGGLTLALRERPAFGAALALDHVDFDSYQRPARAGAPPANGRGVPGNPLALLARLAGFDANVNATATEIQAGNQRFKDLSLNFALLNGRLDINSLSVGDVAGARVALQGQLAGLETSPVATDLHLNVAGENPAALFRLARFEPPAPATGYGPFALDLTVDGPLVTPRIQAALEAAGGRLSAAGQFSPLDLIRGGTIDLTLDHPDLYDLTRRTYPAYRFRKDSGGVSLRAKLTVSDTAITASKIAGTIARTDLSGEISLNRGTKRPLVAATLRTGDLVVDRLLPVEKRNGRRPKTKGGKSERWSTTPLDLSGLRAIDADIDLKSASLSVAATRVDDARIKARLRDGVLDIENFAGRLFDGDAALKGQLADDGGQARFRAAFSLINGDLGAAISAPGAPAPATGRADISADIRGTGRSEFALVSSLSGQGALALRRLRQGPGTAAKGKNSLAGILGVLKSVNGGLVAGNKQEIEADVTATFRAENGLIRSEDVALTSNVGTGAATAAVDLPRWQLNAAGTIRPDTALAGALLADDTGKPPAIPFSLRGSLDAPKPKVDLSVVRNLRIPTSKKQLRNLLIQSLIPGTAPGPAPAPPPAPVETTTAGETRLTPPPPPPSGGPAVSGNAAPRPEDLIRQLIR